MSNAYIRKMAVFIILVTMLITFTSHITDGQAQLDEEQIRNLINEKLDERDKQQTWFGWVLAFLSIAVTVAGTIFSIRFKQHLDLAKEFRQIREDIAELQRWYRDIARRLYTLQTFVIVLALLYGVAIGILAYLNLR
ncbi:MAG: hypothetical protein OXU51_13845 [Candidatus Poribacteria bacterium]|nr:hypothetical protein [Candidatus Poribacteria bacterium]